MRRWIALSLSLALLAQSPCAWAEDPAKPYNGTFFDGSRDRTGAVRGRRRDGKTGIWSDPEKGKFRVKEGRFQPRGVPQAKAMSKEEQKLRAEAPQLFWDWDKTVIAAGGALAGAAIGFLFGGPIGAAVGFLGGMLVAAIAANMVKKDEKTETPPASVVSPTLLYF